MVKNFVKELDYETKFLYQLKQLKAKVDAAEVGRFSENETKDLIRSLKCFLAVQGSSRFSSSTFNDCKQYLYSVDFQLNLMLLGINWKSIGSLKSCLEEINSTVQSHLNFYQD